MTDISALGERCCGCGACAAVCPKGCVAMKADELGFRRPTVDESACVSCGLCERACPVFSGRAADGCESVWWAKARDGGLRARSSSGGVFGLLAENTLARGGAVYGAAFAEGCKRVCHVRVADLGGLDAVMRSKYVQSEMGTEVYDGVERDLRAGLPVLFCGTACQVSGVRGFLAARRAPMDALWLVDVICHGVPSPGLWRMWLGYRETLAGADACGVNFRSKTSGWTSFSVAYEYATEKDVVGGDEACVFRNDWYMRAFLRNASLRGSCFDCPAKRRCGSDLTLGDFWGVGSCHPDAYDELGVSAVVANTPAGVAAVERLNGGLEYGASSFEEVSHHNFAFLHSVKPFEGRDAFTRAVRARDALDDIMRQWPFEPPRKSFLQRAIAKAVRIARRLSCSGTK